jgi:ATP-dependent DNA helicase RecG
LLPAVQHVGEQMLANHAEQAGRLIERWIGSAARYVNA